jgi:hypothetical protein
MKETPSIKPITFTPSPEEVLAKGVGPNKEEVVKPPKGE